MPKPTNETASAILIDKDLEDLLNTPIGPEDMAPPFEHTPEDRRLLREWAKEQGWAIGEEQPTDSKKV